MLSSLHFYMIISHWIFVCHSKSVYSTQYDNPTNTSQSGANVNSTRSRVGEKHGSDKEHTKNKQVIKKDQPLRLLTNDTVTHVGYGRKLLHANYQPDMLPRGETNDVSKREIEDTNSSVVTTILLVDTTTEYTTSTFQLDLQLKLANLITKAMMFYENQTDSIVTNSNTTTTRNFVKPGSSDNITSDSESNVDTTTGDMFGTTEKLANSTTTTSNVQRRSVNLTGDYSDDNNILETIINGIDVQQDQGEISVTILSIKKVEDAARRRRQVEPISIEVRYMVFAGEEVLEANDVMTVVQSFPSDKAEAILGYKIMEDSEISEQGDTSENTPTSPKETTAIPVLSEQCRVIVIILGCLLGISILSFIGYLIYESEFEKKKRKKEKKNKEQIDLKLMTEKDRLLRENAELKGQLRQLEAAQKAKAASILNAAKQQTGNQLSPLNKQPTKSNSGVEDTSLPLQTAKRVQSGVGANGMTNPEVMVQSPTEPNVSKSAADLAQIALQQTKPAKKVRTETKGVNTDRLDLTEKKTVEALFAEPLRDKMSTPAQMRFDALSKGDTTPTTFNFFSKKPSVDAQTQTEFAKQDEKVIQKYKAMIKSLQKQLATANNSAEKAMDSARRMQKNSKQETPMQAPSQEQAPVVAEEPVPVVTIEAIHQVPNMASTASTSTLTKLEIPSTQSLVMSSLGKLTVASNKRTKPYTRSQNEEKFAKATTHFLQEIAPVLDGMGYRIVRTGNRTPSDEVLSKPKMFKDLVKELYGNFQEPEPVVIKMFRQGLSTTTISRVKDTSREKTCELVIDEYMKDGSVDIDKLTKDMEANTEQVIAVRNYIKNHNVYDIQEILQHMPLSLKLNSSVVKLSLAKIYHDVI